MADPSPPREVLRRTRGICNTCLEDVPAEVVITEGVARLEKHCPEHGTSVQLLSRAPDYWREVDRFYFQVNSERYTQRDYLLRLTESCNLDCPICLAKANTEETEDLDLTGIEPLLKEKRHIKLDFMAAEPTVRKDLVDWVKKAKDAGHLTALHTNGLRIADLSFARRMKEAGFDEVFLQFDGFDEEANRILRGRPLLDIKLQALRNLREVGLATSLIVVIGGGINEDQVGEVFRFAMRPENDHIREVFYLGLRILGSLRDGLKRKGHDFAESSLMPDETLDMLEAQVPGIRREDVRVFNKLYFSLLSTFRVKKCLYVQHYLVLRDGKGGFVPFSDLVNLPSLERVAERFASQVREHPRRAKIRFLTDLGLHSANLKMAPVLQEFVRLQLLLRVGMNLEKVSPHMVLLGFITACDPYNFDAQVAVNCGKGEVSADGGFVEAGAVANVLRERRFDRTARTPGALHPGQEAPPPEAAPADAPAKLRRKPGRPRKKPQA
ncbi:MAG: radical SAM protein [Deltaproteobacteria bacterium]|nr:radical SAM protein [Deltaproteobacteria bacterium]